MTFLKPCGSHVYVMGLCTSGQHRMCCRAFSDNPSLFWLLLRRPEGIRNMPDLLKELSGWTLTFEFFKSLARWSSHASAFSPEHTFLTVDILVFQRLLLSGWTKSFSCTWLPFSLLYLCLHSYRVQQRGIQGTPSVCCLEISSAKYPSFIFC